jgi:hypothetical protein
VLHRRYWVNACSEACWATLEERLAIGSILRRWNVEILTARVTEKITTAGCVDDDLDVKRGELFGGASSDGVDLVVWWLGAIESDDDSLARRLRVMA